MGVCIEQVFSRFITAFIAGIEKNVTARNKHTQKRKNPRHKGGGLLSIFLSEAFEKRTQRVLVSAPFEDHLLDVRLQRRRRGEEDEGCTRAHARSLKHQEMGDQPLAREHDHLKLRQFGFVSSY